jgi:Ca2+-transporting ATPase
LALGVTRMVKRHALIRRLPAVETLGATTVICTDKTGTLTKNEMTVTRLFIGGRIFIVTGEGYAPVGEIRDQDQVFNNALPVSLQDLLAAAVLCNDATLVKEQNDWRILGDPTEGALLVVAAKGGVAKQSLEATASLLGEVPFDPERKRMTVVRRTAIGSVAYVKGAPDMLLRACTQYLSRSDSRFSRPTISSLMTRYGCWGLPSVR